MFFTSFRIHNVAITFFALIVFVVSLPAKALDDQTEVPQSVLNLDLCTLAYQFYHQSLCLQLDPWFDMMSRIGSDRRNNICSFTHDYAKTLSPGFYSGPNAARGWSLSNTNLDPILTNYKNIDAHLPTFNRDGEMFLTVQAPKYITHNIKTIECMRYRSKPSAYPYNDCEVFPIRQYESGEDHLVVFEGGTGITSTTSPQYSSEPSWSLMGFVLMKKTATGYDAHIVFRGSRSGSSLLKTVWRAQNAIGEAKGNPDWITDLRSMKQINQPLISKIGKVTEGFAESLPTMLGPVAACCNYLEQKYSAPEHIYVTGHSLGAGLASQFVSSVMQGSFGDELRNTVKSWPWQNAKLIAFAQPIPGDPTWAEEFDKNSPSAEHYWVAGDSVVEATASRIVGLLIDKGEHSGIQHKLDTLLNSADNPHEVFIIRAALLRDLSASNPGKFANLERENTWAYYKTLAEMISGRPFSYVVPNTPYPNFVNESNLRSVLQNSNFGDEFDKWLEQVYARMIVDKSSYIGPKFQSTLDERRKTVLDIAASMRKSSAMDSVQDLNQLESEFKLVDDTLGLAPEEQWIYCAMILNRYQKSNLTLQELQSKPVIKSCLESKFD
ncbi:MAG: hypothetical protein KIT34_13130 [Cyanobacteria bacterium TGS_CYA1]|nr:hypothetical protein [Cyanobacteria bacterium TGS_CYA1]